MALNNYVAEAQPPKWAQKGNVRAASFYEGPAETAKMILSGRWDFTPQRLYERVNAYSDNRLLDWAKAHHVNYLTLVWSPGFSHRGDEVQWRILRDLVRRAHRRGIRIVAYHSLTNCFWQEMFEAEPDSKNWRQLDYDGNDVPYMAAIYTGIVTRILMCVNNRQWRDYVAYKVRKALEAGVDGLFFDNLFSKCYCPICRSAFREYTEKLYGTAYDMPAPRGAEPQRDERTKSGVEVVADSERHKGDLRPFLELARDQFWNDSVADFLRELWEMARQIKPDVVFRHNAHERWPMNLYCNYKSSEDSQPATWSPDGGMWTNVALWKYLYEDGGREKPFFNAVRNKLEWAEEVAFGGEPRSVVDPAWQGWHKTVARRVYAKAQPAGRVGLLMRSLQPIPNRSPLCTLLARKNVQFDILVYEMLLDRYDLSRYEVLLANDVRFMSDEACEKIREFVRAGGVLIASGQTSLFTEHWQLRGDYALADLFGTSYRPGLSGRFTNECGKGRVIFYPASVQDAAAESRDEDLLERWLADVTQAETSPPLRIEAPDGLLASVWRRGRKRIVHLVNYRGEPVRNARMTVCDCRSQRVELLSPDGDVDLAARDVAVTADGVGFTVPEVKTYTVALVG